MADQTKNGKNDLSDDWGEAFEAEDFMFAPEADTNSEFFLDDDTIKGTEVAQEDTSNTQGIGNQPQQPQPNKLTDKLTAAKERFIAAPLPIKAAALIACLLLALGIIFTALSSSDAPPNATIAESDDNVKSASTESSTTQRDTLPSPAVPIALSTKPTPQPATASPPKQIRKKWKLPAFMLATQAGTDHAQAKVLSIDLTLILLLEQGEFPPEKQEIHARELIYQFFYNRPLTELERYSLARGEMIRNLRAWIEKQWPDLPLSSIVFDRYQIL